MHEIYDFVKKLFLKIFLLCDELVFNNYIINI